MLTTNFRVGFRSHSLRMLLATTSLSLMLSGCASFTGDGGMAPVASLVAGEIGKEATKITTADEAAAVQWRVEEILQKPLTSDAAVQVALLNNRGLQAEYNTLGISEASYVEASTPPNPIVSFSLLASLNELEIERRLVANLLSLFTLTSRSKIARTEFEAARYKAVDATFRIAADTRRAFYRAISSRQTVAFLEQAGTSVDATTELTIKLGQTGAATKLDQARASAFNAEVSNQLAEARLRAATDREALARLMGLWGESLGFRLPTQLPNIPGKLPTANQIEAEAIRTRVDLIAARLELEALAKSLGLTNATRFVSLLELAGLSNYVRTVEEGHTEEVYPPGFELEVQIPIFDFGEARVRRSREIYMQAVNRVIEKAVNVRSEVRSAYFTFRATYDISRQFRNQILPLRKSITEQALLQYNGMLIDVFALLTTVRESITSNVAAIAAKRDFLIASVDFQSSIIGGTRMIESSDTGPSVANAAETAGH